MCGVVNCVFQVKEAVRAYKLLVPKPCWEVRYDAQHIRVFWSLSMYVRCRKNECSGVYIAGFFSLSAYRYSAERLSGVAKAQTFVRSPPIYVKSVRVMV
jgi:hypothetical protein